MRQNERRSKYNIIAEILEICSKEREGSNEVGANVTRVIYQVNLNSKTAAYYLDLLTKNGRIKVKNGSPVLYETTDKGKKVLEEYQGYSAECQDYWKNTQN